MIFNELFVAASKNPTLFLRYVSVVMNEMTKAKYDDHHKQSLQELIDMPEEQNTIHPLICLLACAGIENMKLLQENLQQGQFRLQESTKYNGLSGYHCYNDN